MLCCSKRTGANVLAPHASHDGKKTVAKISEMAFGASRQRQLDCVPDTSALARSPHQAGRVRQYLPNCTAGATHHMRSLPRYSNPLANHVTTASRPPKSSLQTRAASTTMGEAGQDKVLHFMRHGQTEMNVYLGHNAFGSEGFQDPLLYDTKLTPEGIRQAEYARCKALQLHPIPEVLIVSPLTRALHTAELAFPAEKCQIQRRIAHPLARERVYLSSDIGIYRSELAGSWEGYDMSELPDEVWWYTENDGDPRSVTMEPEEVFHRRIEELRKHILERPEQCIAVVTHSGVLEALTGGVLFRNGEIRTLTAGELIARTGTQA